MTLLVLYESICTLHFLLSYRFVSDLYKGYDSQVDLKVLGNWVSWIL